MRLALSVPLLVFSFSVLGCSTPQPIELVWETATVRVLEVINFHASVVKGPHQEWQTLDAIVISPGKLQNQKMQFSVPLNSVWSIGSEYHVQIALQRDPKSEDEYWLLRHDPNDDSEPTN